MLSEGIRFGFERQVSDYQPGFLGLGCRPVELLLCVFLGFDPATQGQVGSLTQFYSVNVCTIKDNLIYRATTQGGIWGLGLPRGRLMGGG